MSMMYTDAEVRTLGYQASRMELVRATADPSYDTPAEYVTSVGRQAVMQAETDHDLETVVETMRRWLSGRTQVPGLDQFATALAARSFRPEILSLSLHYV